MTSALVMFSPEGVLCVAVLAVLLLDLLLRSSGPQVYRLSAFSLIIALAATQALASFDLPAELAQSALPAALNSVLVMDKMGLFLKGVVLLLAVAFDVYNRRRAEATR